MRALPGTLLLAVAGLGLAACGISADEAGGILDRAERAGRDLTYRGIVVRRFTLDDEERTTTVRVHHGEAGTRYEADRTGGLETWIHFSATPPEIHWLRDRALLLDSYRLVREGEEAVAGRPAVRYRLEATRPDRPSRRLWVDRENGLLLRDEGLDAAGRVIESMRYETIVFGGDGPVPDLDGGDETADATEPALPEIAPAALEAIVGYVPYRPRALPEGFTLLRCYVRDRHGAVLVYGDGLAGFVVTQHPAGDAPAPDPDGAVEVRRETRRGEIRLGLRLDGTRIDVSSRTIGWNLLEGVVASLARDPALHRDEERNPGTGEPSRESGGRPTGNGG